jgi:plasmid stability protein
MAELRIRLDEVDKALLGAMAAAHGRTEEEEVAAILKGELQRQAEVAVPIEFIELRLEETESQGGTPNRKKQ